jgi:hypothetical protein
MKDWISGVFDLTKVPTKILGVFALVSGTLLFSPERLRQRLFVNELPKPYGLVVSLVFLISGFLVVLAAIAWIIDRIQKRSTKKRRNAELAE